MLTVKKSSLWVAKLGHDLLAGGLLGHLVEQLLGQLLAPVVWREVFASVRGVVEAAALRVAVTNVLYLSALSLCILRVF